LTVLNQEVTLFTGPTGSREEAARAVRQLYDEEGLSGPKIAKRLGLSESYTYDLLGDPTGKKCRARKDQYRGRCEVCGAATSGSNGPNAAPRRCVRHPAPRQQLTAAQQRGRQRRLRIETLWNQDISIEQIAADIGTTKRAIRVNMAHMRATGEYNLPYRHHRRR
jgi:transposase